MSDNLPAVPLNPFAVARQAEQDALSDDDPWRQSNAAAEVWLRSPGFAESTREQYTRIWRSWSTWCAMTNVPPLLARRDDVTAYVAAIQKVGNPAAKKPVPLSRREANRHMAVMSSFYVYAIDDQRTERNPVPRTKDRPKFKVQSRQPHLTRDELAALIGAADAHSPRASALVALMVMACLRVTEAVESRIENLSRQAGVHLLWVTRKEDKSENVPIPPEVYERLLPAIDSRTSGPIIATRTGGAYDRSNAFKLMRELAVAAGLDPGVKVGPHTLRHAYITRGREMELPIEDLQQAAGHESAKTTQGYDRSKFDPDRHPSFKIARDLTGGS